MIHQFEVESTAMTGKDVCETSIDSSHDTLVAAVDWMYRHGYVRETGYSHAVIREVQYTNRAEVKTIQTLRITPQGVKPV